MGKISIIKCIVIFVAGVYAGMLFAPKAHAQSIDTTAASTPHLRAASTNDDHLTLKVFSGNKNMKYVKIFDIIGNEVASIDLSGKTGTMTFNLDGSHLENGIYLCNLYSDKGILETKKVYWSK